MRAVPDSSSPSSASAPGGGRRRAPGAYLAAPLWLRFALALLIATALMVAMVRFVTTNNTDYNPRTNLAVAARANRDAEILIAQDQAPRGAILPRGLAPAAGLEQAIHRRLSIQVGRGGIAGPLMAAHCRSAGPAAGARRPFRCTIESGGVVYPYSGVVATETRRITFCKRDPPPVASDSVPISPLCRS